MLYIIIIATIVEYFHTGNLYYKEIINYELDITNLLINSPQIHDIKVLNITNPQFNEQISLASRKFVNARFQCITKICFKTATLSYIIGFNCIIAKQLQVVDVHILLKQICRHSQHLLKLNLTNKKA